MAANLTEAHQLCKAAGLRLCTRADFATERCCKSGCDLDRELIWTADECTPADCTGKACEPRQWEPPATLLSELQPAPQRAAAQLTVAYVYINDLLRAMFP